MTEHLIEYVARDRTGITAVVTPTGVVDVDTVIRNIHAGHAGYYVAADSWKRTPVRSMSFLGGAYLFANWDGSKRNMLHDLAFRAETRSIQTVSRRSVRRSSLGATVRAFLLGERRPQR
ncbi:hypothetical protein [Curtobacterium sp. ISL-83]|uniref:hypothetical protein n=1 Tax=Curtobacterium sp. ISL-83 TaxID=2819145 RepID=UPI001BEA67B0|nr:hypothetical protein [Curtobacterium sp. ISL-83]MBT2503745.1 hypothetical protein [Curtobacterium sp. ISL-83]